MEKSRPLRARPPVYVYSRFAPLPVLPGVLTLYNQAAQTTGPATPMKIALIKSIRNGVLFDRKYWARHSRTGDALKPVYFSSIIMGDKVQQLNSCASKFGHRPAAGLMIFSGQIP